MTGLFRGGRLAAAIGLIAAYAIALQAVFTTLAPMQVQADGTVAVYCSGSSLSADGEHGTPAPATGKMQCVFCGACASGAVVLPGDTALADLPVERPLALSRPAHDSRTAATHVRDGPARAPPLSV